MARKNDAATHTDLRSWGDHLAALIEDLNAKLSKYINDEHVQYRGVNNRTIALNMAIQAFHEGEHRPAIIVDAALAFESYLTGKQTQVDELLEEVAKMRNTMRAREDSMAVLQQDLQDAEAIIELYQEATGRSPQFIKDALAEYGLKPKHAAQTFESSPSEEQHWQNIPAMDPSDLEPVGEKPEFMREPSGPGQPLPAVPGMINYFQDRGFPRDEQDELPVLPEEKQHCKECGFVHAATSPHVNSFGNGISMDRPVDEEATAPKPEKVEDDPFAAPRDMSVYEDIANKLDRNTIDLPEDNRPPAAADLHGTYQEHVGVVPWFDKIEVGEDDVRFDKYTSGTNQTFRVSHLPTGIVVVADFKSDAVGEVFGATHVPTEREKWAVAVQMLENKLLALKADKAGE